LFHGGGRGGLSVFKPNNVKKKEDVREKKTSGFKNLTQSPHRGNKKAQSTPKASSKTWLSALNLRGRK
jgi:hypothetical protein